MDLAGPQGEIHAVQNRLVAHAGVQTADLKQDRSIGKDHGAGEKGKGEKGTGGREAAGEGRGREADLSPPNPQA
jgi:hypothetical protein